jgi:class 3 adenylate cyclase
MNYRWADLQVVLPFAEPDFLRLSVDYGRDEPEWARWAERYREVLGKLAPARDAVYYATDEPYLGSDRLFGYANEVLQGMAIVRARQLGVTPRALVVVDPAAPPTPGGARHFLGRWERTGNPFTPIDLSELRGDTPADAGADPPSPEPPPRLPRPVRAMLFADVAGFSRMTDGFAPEFFERFTRIVADALRAAGEELRVMNTWGDGVFAVFGRDADETAGGGVAAAAGAALRLLDAFGAHAADWARMKFPDPNPLRVGLHAGPVFELTPDPVLGRTNYFGQHVNRTARIEPITLPGSAYASEQFAALLTVAAPDGFACEFVGVEPLAKGYATAPLYQVRGK